MTEFECPICEESLFITIKDLIDGFTFNCPECNELLVVNFHKEMDDFFIDFVE
jgi:transcription elongation factor Elf1